jgi:hypothetical protein
VGNMGYNTYLITGLDKIDAFEKFPFNAYLHKFGKDVIESDLIIILGVSLGDGHLNAFLTNSLFIDNKRIIIVDYETLDEALNKLSYPFSGSTLTKAWILFNDSKTFALREGERVDDKFREHQETMKKDLETKRFTKITNNITFYIKGVRDFLREYEDIIRFATRG